MLRAGKYRFASCFRYLNNHMLREVPMRMSSDLTERILKHYERAKVNSRCFHWFPAAMLESLRRDPIWRLHTKH